MSLTDCLWLQVVLPDDSTTDLTAGPECAACASKCPLGSGSRCSCCSNRFEPGNLAWFFLHSFPDVLTSAQINATYAFASARHDPHYNISRGVSDRLLVLFRMLSLSGCSMRASLCPQCRPRKYTRT